MSGVTSPARPWFRLTLSDRGLARHPEVRAWLDATEDVLLRIFAASNFYNAMGVLYEELAVFGTAALCILEDYEDVARFYTCTAGEYWLATSSRGVVDTHYRRFPLTIAALVGQYGLANVSAASREAFARGELDREVMVVHAIEPNDRRAAAAFEGGAPDAANMAWRSVHYEAGAADEQRPLLRLGGYRRFPVMCPRWHQTGNDAYGRSPAMDALPDVKALQSDEKDKARAIALMNKPPMTAPASLRNEAHGIVPGSVTYIGSDAQGHPQFRPAFQVEPRIAELLEAIAKKEQQIDSAFYADLFLMVSRLDDVRSATEIVERREEKLIMLGPVLERLHDELLDPAIKRVIDIAEAAATSDRAVLPPRPAPLRGLDLEIDYVSTLAVAQKAVGTAAIERLLGFVGRVGAARPEALDKIDVDAAIDHYAELLTVPPRIVVDTATAARSRAARAQAAAVDKTLATARAAVDGAKVLSETDIGGGVNALQRVLGNG